jgi:lipoprotein-anchoring transpeptidase ErfK/SrfK
MGAAGHLAGVVALGFLAMTAVAAVSPSRNAANVRPQDEPLRLSASLSARQLVVHGAEDSAITFPIAIGKDSKPTPTGTYKIRKIVWNPAWIPPDQKWAKGKEPQAPGAKANPMKVVKIFFKEPDYYIHGTSEVESLGDAASHGCMRMDPDDAYRVARMLMEHGGKPYDENWFWRVVHFRNETKTVYLDNPITLTITD